MGGISGNAGDVGTILNVEIEGLRLAFRVIDATALQMIRNFAKVIKSSIKKYNEDKKLNRSGEMDIIKRITELDPNVQLAHIDKKYLPVLEEYSKKLGFPYLPVESVIPGSDVINIAYPGKKATVMSFIISEIEKKTLYDLKQQNMPDNEAKIKAQEMNKLESPEECMQLVGAGLPKEEFKTKFLAAFSGVKLDLDSMEAERKEPLKEFEKEAVTDFREEKAENFNNARSFDRDDEREVLASINDSTLRNKLYNEDHIGIEFKKEDIVKDSLLIKDGRSFILVNDNVTDLVLVIDSKKVIRNTDGSFTAVAAKNEKIACMDENQNPVKVISGQEYRERALKYMEKMQNARKNTARDNSRREEPTERKNERKSTLKRG